VTTMDAEVERMRRSVDRLDGQVGALRDSVDAELHEVGLAVHPVRRVTRRLRRSDADARD
jgi:cob(I)alamin adenosyltransferase